MNDTRELDEALHDVLRERYNLDEDDIREFVGMLERLRRREILAARLGEWAAKAVITAVVAAFCYHFWETIKHALGR